MSYEKTYHRFLEWLALERILCQTVGDVDLAASELMEQMYLDGDQTMGTASVLKACILYFNAQFRTVPRPLPLCTRALTGW